MTWRRSRRAPDVDASAGIRQMIARIAAQRTAATSGAAGALVAQGRVQQALAQQRRELDAAQAALDAAVELARRVADDVLAQDGPDAAAPYLSHVEGLRSQDGVLDLATEQIDALRENSAEYAHQARALLDESRRSLDDALREQLRLLIAVERLEYQRVLLQARARAAERGRHG